MGRFITWLMEPDTVEERRERIGQFLELKGGDLPGFVPNVDRSETGKTHMPYSATRTVLYSVVDQEGRKVYHYDETEVDHIMIGRVEHDDLWAIEHIARIPQILGAGHIVFASEDKVVYHSRSRFRRPDGAYCILRVIVKRDPVGRWYVETFYPKDVK